MCGACFHIDPTAVWRIMQQSDSSPTRPTLLHTVTDWRFWLGTVGLVLLATIVYWPTQDNGFLSDDWYYIKNNVALTSLSGLSDIWFKIGTIEQYYPLVHTTFWVENFLWGAEPRGYHVVNFVLHGINAVLVWRLLARLEVPGAWLAAALFAVHPVEVETVAWASERKNVLSCLMALLSLSIYLRFAPATPSESEEGSQPVRGSWMLYGMSLVMYVAALLSKSVMVSVPAVVLVIYWWKRGRIRWRDVAPLIPFFAVGIVLAVLTIWMEKNYVGAHGQEWDLSLADRLLIAGRAVWFYTGKLIWPAPLVFFYPRWVIDPSVLWQWLFPAAALALIAGLWFARSRIGRGPLAAVLIFVGVLTPALGFFNVYPFRYSFVADHYQYHASIAMFALATAGVMLLGRWLFDRWPAIDWSKVAPLVSAALLAPLAFLAWERTHVFKDDIVLDENVVEHDPESWIAQYNLGIGLRDRGDFDGSIEHWKAAVEIRKHQVRDNPRTMEFLDELGRCYVNLGFVEAKADRLEDALASHRRAVEVREQLIKLQPDLNRHSDDLAASHMDVGLLYERLGQLSDAELAIRTAIKVREQLIQRDPDTAAYQVSLAGSYQSLAAMLRNGNRVPEVEAAFQRQVEVREQLLRDDPENKEYQDALAVACLDLGLVQNKAGHPADATRSFHQALKLCEKLVLDDPTSEDYQAELAWCHADIAQAQQKLGRVEEAIADYGKAIEIRERLVREHPDNPDFCDALAASYVEVGLLARGKGRTNDAIASFQKANALREALVREHPSDSVYQAGLGWGCANLAVAQLANRQLTESIVSGKRAAEVREKLVREFPNDKDYQTGLGWTYANLGVAQMENGQFADAEASHRNALNVRARLLQDYPGVDDYKHEIALSCRDLGNVQSASGKYDEAIIFYDSAIEIHDKLLEDYPTNPACQANLANDLGPCGDAQAMLGKWEESAETYVKATRVSNYHLQTLWRSALLQLAAGNEANYRRVCAELVRRYGNKPPRDALFGLAFALTAGDNSLADMAPAVEIARRLAEEFPNDPLCAVLTRVARVRASSDQDAIGALEKKLDELAALPPSEDGKTSRAQAARLLGEACLATVYRTDRGKDLPKERLDGLRDLIEKTASKPMSQADRDLPPWTGAVAVEVARNALSKLGVQPSDGK